jgi:hypothetical protein
LLASRPVPLSKARSNIRRSKILLTVRGRQNPKNALILAAFATSAVGECFALHFPDVCGITGIVASGSDIDADHLAGMIAMLNHRGPDDRGVHIEPGAGLAHSRLSILDIAGGCQPMANEDFESFPPGTR